jgi:two-component system sensor histidine kinase BaeS
MTAPSSRRPPLTRQLVLVLSLVAVLAVVVTGLVSYPLVANASQAQAREQLGAQAELLAEVVDRSDGAGMGQMMTGARLRQLLTVQGIEVQVVRRNGSPTAPVTQADVDAVRSGASVSEVRGSGTGAVYLEGRPAGNGAAAFLVQDAGVASSQTGLALRRFLLAALVGLLVAVVIGWLVARRVVRPLRDASAAARRMSAGARDVALPVEGPEEVAQVSESLNTLSAALASSEGRQRDFLLSVSHELRTPLTGIAGYAEALADGVVPPDQAAGTGAVVLTEARRLERLVADLLDLARLGAADLRLNPSDVDLAALCGEAAAVWEARCAKEGVPFVVEASPVAVVADPLRVRQIVDNLCENALRVTPSGRPLVLACGHHEGWGAVEVRDGGPGLTADDVAVAFEPSALYERYRGVRKVGTGIGLALVGRLAARMGGRAYAAAAPEGGARIGVLLPPAGSAAPTVGP